MPLPYHRELSYRMHVTIVILVINNKLASIVGAFAQNDNHVTVKIIEHLRIHTNNSFEVQR